MAALDFPINPSLDDVFVAPGSGANYRWDGEKKIWWKYIKEPDLVSEKAEADFNVVTLLE